MSKIPDSVMELVHWNLVERENVYDRDDQRQWQAMKNKETEESYGERGQRGGGGGGNKAIGKRNFE